MSTTNHSTKDGGEARHWIDKLERKLRRSEAEVGRLRAQGNPERHLLITLEGEVEWHFGEVEGMTLVKPGRLVDRPRGGTTPTMDRINQRRFDRQYVHNAGGKVNNVTLWFEVHS